MRKVIFWGLLISLVVAVFLSLLASASPDGLEKVAERLGFSSKRTEFFHSPMSDYIVPGISDEKVATALAGTFGTLAIFGVAYGVGRLVKKRNRNNQKKEKKVGT